MFHVDGNGLYLSTVAISGYKGVTVSLNEQYSAGFIPYVNIRDPKMMNLKKQNGFNQAPFGFDNVQRLWYNNDTKMLSFEDVRAAAYVAQKFEENLEENLLRFYNGDMSVVPRPPDDFNCVADENAIRRVNDYCAEYKNKQNKPKTRGIKYDAQSAIVKVYSDNPKKYSKPSLHDMPKLRDYINEHRPMFASEYLRAAEEALLPFVI
jgi:hypothetical protein